jgi:putative membrane protein (TIGR04086 family)
MPRLRVAAVGAGAALAIAFPVALLAQIVDALADTDDPPWPVYLLVPVVLGAMVLGGWVAGRRTSSARPWIDGTLAAVLAIVVVLAIGVIRRAAADESIAWATVPATAAAAAILGATGGVIGGRSPGRTRP